MSKIALVLAAAGGYVLGAKAGRERYEQIQQQASRLWSDPRVQRAKEQAQDKAAEAGAAAKDTVQEKVQDVRSSSSGADSTKGAHSAASGPAHSVPTPADMPDHPTQPGTVAGGPGAAS